MSPVAPVLDIYFESRILPGVAHERNVKCGFHSGLVMWVIKSNPSTNRKSLKRCPGSRFGRAVSLPARRETTGLRSLNRLLIVLCVFETRLTGFELQYEPSATVVFKDALDRPGKSMLGNLMNMLLIQASPVLRRIVLDILP